MVSEVSAPREYGLGKTERRDSWWVGPLATAMGLGGFIVYSTFRAIYNGDYVSVEGRAGWGELLSPFYSPLILLPGRRLRAGGHILQTALPRCRHRSSRGAGAKKFEEAKILDTRGKVRAPRASKPGEGTSRVMILTMGTQNSGTRARKCQRSLTR